MADQQRRGAVPDVAAAVGVLLGGNAAAGGGLEGRGNDQHRPGLAPETEAKGTPAGGMAGILGGGLVSIIWTLMGTPYGIQCAIVAVPASVIAILIVSAVTRCNDPKRSLEALYQDN